MLVFASGWMDPAQDDAMIAESRALYNAIEPYMGGYYDNIEFDQDAATSNYGPAYERLSRIKGQHGRPRPAARCDAPRVSPQAIRARSCSVLAWYP